MSKSNPNLENLDLTNDELNRFTSAFKNDEFKKMFFDYCEEIQNPENRKIYEDEIKQLELERGVEVKFLNPLPGFVIKTSVDGKMKCFLNICISDEIEKPTNIPKRCQKTGKNGLNWSIPLAQAPFRHDYDNKNTICLVYDILFHSETLYLSKKNIEFRKLLIDTAMDAVEREFNVKLDRLNLKYPKLKFKGIQRPTVIRKLVKNHENNTQDDIQKSLDKILPPIPLETEPKLLEKSEENLVQNDTNYTIPNYVIKHSKNSDISELTNSIDAKLNLTIPNDLIVEIKLPLLTSTSDCTLDVTEKQLYLKSEQPAKYKLNITLPYQVQDSEGSAKFDRTTRILHVRLPILLTKEKKLKDLLFNREDSGVESDATNGGSGGGGSSGIESPKTIERNDTAIRTNGISSSTGFLSDTIKYNFPSNFTCNTLDENLVFTLNYKNVDPKSVEYYKTENTCNMKFITIGSGFFPIYYSLFIGFTKTPIKIIDVDIETWDNNIILTLTLSNYQDLHKYDIGLMENDTKEYKILDECHLNTKDIIKSEENQDNKLNINVQPIGTEQIEIEISTKNPKNHDENDPKSCNKRNNKKKNKKRRSLSESYCDDLKYHQAKQKQQQQDQQDQQQDHHHHHHQQNHIKSTSPTTTTGRKSRSFSESRTSSSLSSSLSSSTNDFNGNHQGSSHFKGILKHHSRYGRSISESYSSFDDHIYSCSITDSFNEIPEEDDDHIVEHDGLSESCKKTVRFSDVIRKQLFRMDSSILGQRKKNQKRKNQKQRALQRRNSEGDSIDYEDKSPRSSSLMERKASQHDSGLDLSIDGIESSSSNRKDCSNKTSHSNLMFDIEI